ncbi:unnamed protein product [Bathycoccus prasinos]
MPKTPPLRGGGGGKGGFRGKKKKKSKGPQLPKYVQEQLASREKAAEAESSDGFGNANFRGRGKKSDVDGGGFDDDDDDDDEKDGKEYGRRRGGGFEGIGGRSSSLSRKQKRAEMKHEKKMNKKRRFETLSAKKTTTKAKATTPAKRDDEKTKTKKKKRETTTAPEKESKSKKNGKEKKMAPADGARGVGGMRQSLLDAYKEDEFNAKQLEKKMGKKKIDDGLDLFIEGLPGLELLGGGGGGGSSGSDDESEEDDSDDAMSEEEEYSSSSEEEDEEQGEDEEDEDALEAAHANFMPSATKYVPPAQRAAMKAAAEAAPETENYNKSKKSKTARDIDDPSFETQRRIIRGLLNRLGEANVANIVAEISAVAREHPRKTVGDCVSEELVHKALAEGPKASESYCAAIACLVAGCSGEIGPEFAARFAANVCEQFERERLNDESSRPASNLALCLAKLYNIGLFPSSVVYGCLISLAKTLSEMDAGLTLTILKVSGGKLRGEDPVGMKSYIDAVERNRNWWLPEAAGTEEWFKKRNAERSSNANNDGVDGNETQLLQLAKKMRMNTETRRAIFCVVMSSEDYADCLERLLKLPLSGQGDREIVRVILECCLQEKAFNPYYAILTSKLVERQKRHRLTLRLCIQDQLKEIKSGENEETSSVRRVANLAKFFAHTVASNALGANALRILEMSEFENMNSRINLFNRLFCRAILEDRQRTAKIDLLFAKLREKKEYNDLARDFARTFTSREITRGVEDEAARKRIRGRGLALKQVITEQQQRFATREEQRL